MLEFLYRWLPKVGSASQPDDNLRLPFPVTEKSRWKRNDLQLDTTSVSPPIPRFSPQSLTGFDDHYGHWHRSYPSPTRGGPSNVEWISSIDSVNVQLQVTLPRSVPPAVVRVPPQSHIHPIGRSVSSPPTSPSYSAESSSSSSLSFSGTPSPKWNLKLNTGNPAFSQSTHSLRLDPHPYATNTDLFGYANNYPLAKQLSPIAEMDYFSPESLRFTKPLPGSSDREASPSESHTLTNPSPGGSQSSEVTRPSPCHPHPFITRQLNRTISTTSSRTQISTTSTIPRVSTKSSPPPSIPPLNLSPPFPGPHPSQNGNGPPLRPRRSYIVAMPTIAGSYESECHIDDQYGGDEDLESLHAESFVTASDLPIVLHPIPTIVRDGTDDVWHQDTVERSRTQSLPSVQSGRSRPSASESFINRRWDRDLAFGSGVVIFRAKRQWISATPAFWAFWLGFVFPFLWLVGGWHFTNFGEQPPRLTFWEFYFNAGYWKERFCGGRQCKPQHEGKGPMVVDQHPLPKWVAEKQSSDDGRARLNDPKRSLRGISFGYPFISRPVQVPRGEVSWYVGMIRYLVGMLQKPHRIFDQLYGVKLKEVRGRPESGRRMFDPWIQRCRYAFCYALIFLCIGLCTACTYLIIYNTRQLR